MENTNERYCVPDLQKERNNCSFNKDEITYLFDGGKENTLLRKNIENFFLSKPEFQDEISSDYLSHEERYTQSLRKIVALMRLMKEDSEAQEVVAGEGMRILFSSGVEGAVVKDGNPLAVHYVMFIPAIMWHGTEDQQQWLVRALAGEIIGTYAQTELGHGTFLRGLETTATYDERTEEFVLHCPTISSYKWWPGGLGKSSNYAIVMAQLHTQGKCYGPHPFMVQLRNEDTFASLPGITLGEIGPKLGLNANDNGYLGFNQHRIPRSNMLMRFAQVLKDGTYVKPPSKKLAYGSMITVRVAVGFHSVKLLQLAVTIAARYSAVRHQSELVAGQPEPQIIEYQTQQFKILPQLASVFAMLFAAKFLRGTYEEVTSDIKGGNMDQLPELHALACGLKALCSSDSAIGVDICRRACGGHGYLGSSNLPRLWTIVTAASTYEGENTVLWLQVARYIMKAVKQSQFSANGSLRYFNNESSFSVSPSDFSNEGLLKRWQKSVFFYVREAFNKLNKLVNSGMTYEHAWNNCSVTLVQCAEAHTRYFVCEQFTRNVQNLAKEMSHPTLVILQKLCRLYLLYQLHLNQGIFLRSGAITGLQLSTLENEMYELLADLRPHAVSIVDAFDIDDRILNSTLGAWDGNVYQRLFDEAQKSPLNQRDVTDAFHKYLKPLMKSKL